MRPTYGGYMQNIRLFSSESVTEGHPDKICDLIADSILDEALRGDEKSRVACEVCCSTGMTLVMGEFTTSQYIDIQRIVRGVIKSIGYNDPKLGFDYHNCAVLTYINEQSPDISMGVSDSMESKKSGDPYDLIGAGDQGMMFGFACTETEELMPLPIALAHKLTKKLTEVRKNGVINYLRPDGKAQVTVAYDGFKPLYVDTVVVSAQHDDSVNIESVRNDVAKKVIEEVIPKELLRPQTKIYINPTGRFVIGGPAGDSGVTGRKIIVDTYGGMCPHGGGAFSGKDPTKVDRSACYYARYVCKNIVKAGLCDRIELQVAYAIGRAHPVSVCVNTFGTGKVSDSQITEIIAKEFDFRPAAIIDKLELRKPVYAATTNYGHFGKSDLPWEQTDKSDELRKYLG